HVAFVFADTPHTRVYALSLHDALPISVEPWRGTNLVALDLSGIAHAVGVQPWVERVTLSKRLPDGLAIRVTERKAVALFREGSRSEEHTSELQSRRDLVCRLLLEKKKQ